MAQPFYDPTKTYEENYEKGPFGDFANDEVFQNPGEPQHDFLGFKVNEPFGIPAGPLLNSRYVEAAFKKGYDICVYKTVRANAFPCHPFPNVLAVHPEGDLTIEKAQEPLVADTNYTEPIAITNSFGVPSKEVPVWQEDARKGVAAAGAGQVMVMSFMGTVKEGQTEEEFLEDHRQAAQAALDTGAPILEVNLSCPNIGNEGLICYNLGMTRKVAAVIRDVIGTTPLILKVGYYADDDPVRELIKIADEYADAISAINTIQATIIDEKGEQALPGPLRAKSGVCGAPIKWAGLDMTRRLHALREEGGHNFKIIGVGGVTTPQDYQEYRAAGADAVMSATGAMWNPGLAQEIKTAA